MPALHAYDKLRELFKNYDANAKDSTWLKFVVLPINCVKSASQAKTCVHVVDASFIAWFCERKLVVTAMTILKSCVVQL